MVYNIISSYAFLPHSYFGNTLPRSKLSMNESMNQWKKSLSSGMIKNESYFVRTRNIVFDLLIYKQTITNICKYLLMIDQQYIFICKLNHPNWMKTEGDTIFSHDNNAKQCQIPSQWLANNVSSHSKLNKRNQPRIEKDTVCW
jgi:hypothetical protein